MLPPVLVAGALLATVLAAGPKKKATPSPTPSPTPTPIEVELRLRHGDWTHYVADDEEAQEIVREVFTDLGLEAIPAAMPSDVATKWSVTESNAAHPYTARRYRLMATVQEGKCWLRIRAETNIELELERRQWIWGSWMAATPSEEEALVFEKARGILLERLSKPDPEATPVADGEGAGPLDVTSIGIEPVPIHQPAPVRPKSKRVKGPGTVVLEIVVDAGGAVTEAKVTKSDPLFDDAAVAAVKEWRYQPLFLHGEPIRWRKEITVTF